MGCLRKYRFSVAWSALVLLLSVADFSGVDIDNLERVENFDKWVHAVLYAVMSVLFAYEVGYCTLVKKLITFVFPPFYGGLMELIQQCAWVQRSASWSDFLANIVGCVVGLLFYYLILKRRWRQMF